MMYTMPKNLLSICVNFALATQLSKKLSKKPLTKPASVCIIILVADSEATRQEENASVLELVDRHV